jgi:hypothetical protein
MNCGHVPEVRETTCRISRRRVDDRVVSRYTGRLWTENIIIIIIMKILCVQRRAVESVEGHKRGHRILSRN